jgi:6-phosphogluconolactonase
MKKIISVVAILIFFFTSKLSAKDFFVYFGTYTNQLSQGIYVSRLDVKTGKLSAPELAAEAPNPCFINLSPDEKFLYSANSVKFNGENVGSVSAFAIDKTSGKLTLLNQKSSGGNGPCHISVDASGKILFVANYGGGNVKSISLNKDGSLGDDRNFFQFYGHGANTNRQTSPHAHFMIADPSNRFALACDLGTDKIMIYKLADGKLTPAEIPFASVPPGSGSRHLAFSRNGKFIYVINEMGCTISTFAWDSKNGKMDLRETISALPPGVNAEKNFTAAEILVSPNGKFVYATIRGHDSVSVFATTKSGQLKFLQNVSADGKIPRGLGIDPTGRWLIVTNQKTDNAVEFAIDKKSGKLSTPMQELKIGSPVDVKFVPD